MPVPSAYGREALLLQRCAAGDATAFSTLVQPYLAPISAYIRRCVDYRDDADEIQQDVVHKAFEYISGHPNSVKAFFPWLRAVAKNTVAEYVRRKAGRPTIGLDDDGLADIPDMSPDPLERVVDNERHLEQLSLWDFLCAQLQEVFLDSSGTSAARADGFVRLLAFLMYYRDGRSVPDILCLLEAHARRLDAVAPSAEALNNWLPRGRLLRIVLQHLLHDHAGYLSAVVSEAIRQLPMSRVERRFAVAYWLDGLAIEEITSTCRFTEDECRELTETYPSRGDSPPLFERADDGAVGQYRLPDDSGALLYHSIRARLLDELLRMTKETLHASRKE